MNEIELLAPVGSFDALKAAVQNGANAVYLGGKDFSARASANNFDREELIEAVKYAHIRDVRVFVTTNTLIKQDEIEDFVEYAKFLYDIDVDALIMQDIGVAMLIHDLLPDFELHASTQMVAHSLEDVQYLESIGFKRVVLARELTVDEIKYICDNTNVDIEIFVHGALCVCYSGGCLMSSMIGNRSGNRGRCAQPCRQKYTMIDISTGEEIHSNGEYLLSTKDLNTIEDVDKIIETGVLSLKIEGRMKTAYYVATVVRAYRMAIDEFYRDPENWKFNPMWMEELKKGSHRHFTSGFYLNKPTTEDQNYQSASYVRNYDFIGIVRETEDEDGLIVVEQRNKMCVGDEIEVMGPYKETMFTKIEEMYNEEGEAIESAPHPRQIVKLKLSVKVGKDYMLRKVIEEKVEE